jgi:hypothetical protein
MFCVVSRASSRVLTDGMRSSEVEGKDLISESVGVGDFRFEPRLRPSGESTTTGASNNTIALSSGTVKK